MTTTPDPVDLSQAHAEITRLRAENEQLRAELKRRQALPRSRSIDALKFGGSFLLPMIDRQRVFRTFIAFFNEASYYTLPKEHWPQRELVLERARDFGLAMIRFFVKRRFVIFMFSLLAFLMPLVQVWLVFQQNAIIENQNKYFNIQVYDIVAKSLTGSDTTAKQITSALLAREDFQLVNGIIESVFASETGGSFTKQDVEGGALFLEETAARGHLISAMSQALETQEGKGAFAGTWEQSKDTLGLVAGDAGERIAQLLPISRALAFQKPTVGQECFRYLFSLSSMLRRTHSLSVSLQTEADYYKAVAPLVSRLSQLRLTDRNAPYVTVFVTAFHEVLIDIAQKPKFGQPIPPVDAKDVDRLLKAGFRTLVDRTKATGLSVNEAQLKRLLEVP